MYKQLPTILDKIIRQKEIEVAALKTANIDYDLQKYPIYSFLDSLHADKMNIISEIKRASPSKGMINAGVDPIKQARTYAELGAKAISVLTDEQFFKGSMEDLKAVATTVTVPVLCKDFMISRIQIDEARAHGASMILLIVAALDDDVLQDLYTYATSLGLEVLVEVHDEEEMKRAQALNAQLIGVNNRNLKTFEVDLQTTGRLADFVEDENTIFVSESGIQTRQDVEEVAKLGAAVILVGETLMRSNDLSQAFAELTVPLPKVAE